MLRAKEKIEAPRRNAKAKEPPPYLKPGGGSFALSAKKLSGSLRPGRHQAASTAL